MSLKRSIKNRGGGYQLKKPKQIQVYFRVMTTLFNTLLYMDKRSDANYYILFSNIPVIFYVHLDIMDKISGLSILF